MSVLRVNPFPNDPRNEYDCQLQEKYVHETALPLMKNNTWPFMRHLASLESLFEKGTLTTTQITSENVRLVA